MPNRKSKIENRKSNDLDAALWAAWLKVEDKVLNNQLELRRRLGRRAKAFDHIPRPLCLAIKASDHRITAMNAHLSPGHAMRKGHETEHDVLLVADTVKDLCRPVELYWGQEFRELAGQLGAPRQVPRRLERRGIILCRRIAGLGGQHGLPVPLVDSPVPPMTPRDARDWERYGPKLLDPGAWGYTAPDKLLLPYWRNLSLRLPECFEQTLRRKPIFRVQRGQLRFMHWVWLCPECNHPVNTIYLPLGAPDFATLHEIQLPNTPQPGTVSDGIPRAGSVSDGTPRAGSVSDGYEQPGSGSDADSLTNQKSKIKNQKSLACQRCHHIFGLARTPKSIAKSWSLLVAHLSGGLLFGREVKRPASFCALRQNKNRSLAAPRRSPRRDQLERYLAHTDLPLKEIARRMHWTYASVNHELHLICRNRHLKGGRPALKRWWARNHAGQTHVAA